jgi:hypothetical protein
MTSYRGMDGVAGRPGAGSSGTQLPATTISYAGSFLSGIVFTVTAGGCFFEGFWDYLAPGASTAARRYALWAYNGPNPAAGTQVVAGSNVTSGSLSAGWNFTPVPSPIPVAVGTPYMAAAGINGNFSDTPSQFNSGDPYSAGIINGPLHIYSGPTGSFPAPANMAVGSFSAASSDPWSQMPGTPDSGGDASSNFWLDVQVSDSAPVGYSGTWRFQPNTPFPDYESGADDNQPYNLATQFGVTSPVAPRNAWFLSPAAAVTAAGLPTEVAIWRLVAGTWSKVWENLSPAWSGTVGSGWVSTVVPSGVSLPVGTYKVACYNKNGAAGVWSYKRIGFFAPQSSFRQLLTADAVCGPITIPITANAALATDNVTSASEPGQATYSVGSSGLSSPPAPSTFVGTAGSANGQYYGVDIEVSPISILQGAGALSAAATLSAAAVLARRASAAMAALPALSAGARMTALAHAAMAAAPVVAVQAVTSRHAAAALTAAPAVGAIGRTTAAAHLSASAVLTCSTLEQRITIMPGNVSQYGLNSYGPPVSCPAVTVPGVSDGIYDS